MRQRILPAAKIVTCSPVTSVPPGPLAAKHEQPQAVPLNQGRRLAELAHLA